MYFGVGKIGDLLEWFHSSGPSERMLCLFVPAGPDDEKLLGQLFDARGSISPYLGNDIALCLFSTRATLTEVRARNPESSDNLFIPGLVGMRNHPRHWQNWRTVNADLVPVDVREEVLRRSHAVGYEIAKHFDIDHGDLPCLVFVAPGEDAPFIIRTRGSADLDDLRRLFSKLAEVIGGLQRYGLLRIPWRIAERGRLISYQDELIHKLDELDGVASRELASAAEATRKYGLGPAILAVGSSRSHHLFRYLGLPHKDKRPVRVSVEVAEAARAAVLDPSAHAALRAAVNAGRRRRKIEIKLEKVKGGIKSLDHELSFETVRSRLRTIEDMIDEICTEYEGRFRRHRRYMALNRFIRVFTGATKAAEGLTSSLGSTMDNIAKGTDTELK
jgi:hypothetical protein